eukprot:15128_1
MCRGVLPDIKTLFATDKTTVGNYREVTNCSSQHSCKVNCAPGFKASRWKLNYIPLVCHTSDTTDGRYTWLKQEALLEITCVAIKCSKT